MPQEAVFEDNKKKDRSGFRNFVISPMEKLLWPFISSASYGGPLRYVCLELSSLCNADCVFCAYQLFPENREKGFISEDIFKKTVSELEAVGIEEVMLSPDLGEPTLAPGFLDKMEAMRRAGVKKIEITTNAIALHKIGIEDFLSRGPDVINISTTGFEPEMFRRIYRCTGYEKMKENVLELLEKNSRLARPHEINAWLRIDMPLKEAAALPSMDKVRALANDLCWMTEVDSWNGRITGDMLPGTMKLQSEKEPITSRPCRMLLSVVIRTDGGVHACSCRNIENDAELYLGNIAQEGLLACYAKLPVVMERWRQGLYPEVCKSCDMYHDPRANIFDYLAKRVKKVFAGPPSPPSKHSAVAGAENIIEGAK